ncbi:hypothetical protein C3F09_05265 [candidate division GN15 bacterium]|uniref:Uncharacterized protein n=1 Tax=candidate division GN15 bacterium TaxID=2072418 RepID=A0A855X1S7_9BACT|nr:MAG: hypothetical protein C3F09_05265 [candidate division GN15 bacterium]
MFVWCGVLFCLGIAAFVDSVLNMGEIFRTVNSVLFMLLSLALLVRTTTKKKERKVEHYEEKIFHLEREVNMLKQHQKQLSEF